MTNWDKYPSFSAAEMACKCGCGQADMDDNFMSMLQGLRNAVGPIPVTSGYRCEEYNKSISGGPAHPAGMAVDVAVSRASAYRMLKTAFLYGFSGIGIQQKGDGRFLHLDTLKNSPTAPRPTIWSY